MPIAGWEIPIFQLGASMSPITRNDLNAGIAPATPVLSIIDWIAFALTIIGAINWGLVGALNFDLVAAIFGQMTAATRVVYILVGVAGLYSITMAFKLRRTP